MKPIYQLGDFHWVKYDGMWVIAQLTYIDKDEPEEEGAFNKWVRFGASGWNREYDFTEIDPNPIKRES